MNVKWKMIVSLRDEFIYLFIAEGNTFILHFPLSILN